MDSYLVGNNIKKGKREREREKKNIQGVLEYKF